MGEICESTPLRWTQVSLYIYIYIYIPIFITECIKTLQLDIHTKFHKYSLSRPKVNMERCR
jgi:hypothetical protein